jgi:hypothetical protein
LAEGNCQADALVSPLNLQVDTSSPVQQTNNVILSSNKTPELFINIFISPKNKLIKLLNHDEVVLAICPCLLPLKLFQMDVTHTPSFGRQLYVHVLIDTYSGFDLPLQNHVKQHAIS